MINQTIRKHKEIVEHIWVFPHDGTQSIIWPELLTKKNKCNETISRMMKVCLLLFLALLAVSQGMWAGYWRRVTSLWMNPHIRLLGGRLIWYWFVRKNFSHKFPKRHKSYPYNAPLGICLDYKSTPAPSSGHKLVAW